MLGWPIGFLAMSAISAVFGFSGISSASEQVAQDLFYVFIALFIMSFLRNVSKGGEASDDGSIINH